MSTLIIPTIGSKGFFKVKAPFDSYINETEQYTCQGVRSIGDYIAFNEDPLNNIYLFYGLTEDDFDGHVKDNMMIVSLQSENGQWVYVPASHLLTYPLMNGIPYQVIMLGVSLGAIPNTTDLAPIQTLVSNVIYENYGVMPEIKPVILSKPKLVDSETHTRIEGARLARAVGKKTDFGRFKQLEQQYNALREHCEILEDFIRTNMGNLNN